MLEKEVLLRQTAAALQARTAQLATPRAVLGFDGFVDEIVRIVDKRESLDRYTALPSLTALADRIAEAAGKSTNLELVVQQMKLGGNGPIMANALAAFGVAVTYIGNLGYPTLHPVFQELARRAQVISIAEPGHTDAIEFEDGKLMLGKITPLNDITWENLMARVSGEQLLRFLQEAGLLGLLNWTMIPHLSDIWQHFLKDLCPLLKHRPLMFFDLADPAKRLTEDIHAALQLLSRFQQYADVMLGVNEKESYELAEVLGIHVKYQTPEAVEKIAVEMRAKLGIGAVVVHPREYAVAATEDEFARVTGPFTPKPLISTGGGDHFNAGFCLGALLQLPLASCLLTGVATSGFYVRTAQSPTVDQLVEFIRHWPE
ncbi:MAG: PfkB family carbohydrate kinase [candidate division KSB1 bacterium]|nr:PfkB family carbohydrate kinase [candidate division KSB1 bacterium]MDZ7275700.1 PfkB family carbohydrate kinase [candidate division KSB1 bacterium]MDZ7284609.1 PfkB family carbohydrate kinase [candidate division KSB1 bacterium]MDZ7297972.1 PfkB family carbohydrate kinase [candidate division KSB1 bacterium]MDZ7305860.1 PfkB family carbohydrate kinase [candidate division KSB1 bacterium]